MAVSKTELAGLVVSGVYMMLWSLFIGGIVLFAIGLLL
jgi:hypothetical protein